MVNSTTYTPELHGPFMACIHWHHREQGMAMAMVLCSSTRAEVMVEKEENDVTSIAVVDIGALSIFSAATIDGEGCRHGSNTGVASLAEVVGLEVVVVVLLVWLRLSMGNSTSLNNFNQRKCTMVWKKGINQTHMQYPLVHL